MPHSSNSDAKEYGSRASAMQISAVLKGMCIDVSAVVQGKMVMKTRLDAVMLVVVVVVRTLLSLVLTPRLLNTQPDKTRTIHLAAYSEVTHMHDAAYCEVTFIHPAADCEVTHMHELNMRSPECTTS
jgi:hypothetical protein